MSPESLSSNADDKEVMAQMRKRQQLTWRDNYISILGLSMTLLLCWKGHELTFWYWPYAGGPVALEDGFLSTASGILARATFIAEMALMCPISDAQYHWTNMFASPASRVLITIAQGWVTAFSWQATIMSLKFIFATQILGIMRLSNPKIVFEERHTTRQFWSVQIRPATELFASVCHTLYFTALGVVVLALDRNAFVKFVFIAYINETGWENRGIAWFIAKRPKSVHTVPKTIVATVIVNGALAWRFLLISLYSISDINAVLQTITGSPIFEIFHQATKFTAAATLKGTALITLSITALFGALASLSAQLSLSTIRLYTSYMLPIACLLPKWLRDANTRKAPGQAFVSDEAIASRHFPLGRWAEWVSSMALPTVLPLTAGMTKYAGPVFVLALLFTRVVDYAVRRKKKFRGPTRERKCFGQWGKAFIK
ncbi:hypothetical protein K432DRAFT_415755 [Lepidopterella palustris CBS 459.81]|uniref:Uncharacterized protein n=1 Tax=Lepidopterella palustris CBS 459.81 TaxID=1314670 RepID=A0A8E2JH76_9PEZI|nr:hypothetical protein K432DRAFT_415755 [Lepidopterella palustris CBS 459.81]